MKGWQQPSALLPQMEKICLWHKPQRDHIKKASEVAWLNARDSSLQEEESFSDRNTEWGKKTHQN